MIDTILYHCLFFGVHYNGEVLAMRTKIQLGRLKPSIRTHIDHVKHVKTIVSEKQRQDDNSCPKCGKPMILRTARSIDNQGKQFWGCSGFPKCRTTRQIAWMFHCLIGGRIARWSFLFRLSQIRTWDSRFIRLFMSQNWVTVSQNNHFLCNYFIDKLYYCYINEFLKENLFINQWVFK
jgi:ssDNA-binding Zn-finger/Zn-ribbon topoisomerase 1